MQKLVIQSSLSLGLIFVIIYLFLCWKRKHAPDLVNAINIFFCSIGFIVGPLLFFSAFQSKATVTIEDFPLYIAIGGFAVLFVAVIAMKSYLTVPSIPDDEQEDNQEDGNS